MDMKTYREQFDKFIQAAKNIKSEQASTVEYQNHLYELADQAREFYLNNAEFGEPDYQSKIDIFLEFDEYLKQLKRDRLNQDGQKAAPNLFFSRLIPIPPGLNLEKGNPEASHTPKS
jgi:hypothetical protein